MASKNARLVQACPCLPLFAAFARSTRIYIYMILILHSTLGGCSVARISIDFTYIFAQALQRLFSKMNTHAEGLEFPQFEKVIACVCDCVLACNRPGLLFERERECVCVLQQEPVSTLVSPRPSLPFQAMQVVHNTFPKNSVFQPHMFAFCCPSLAFFVLLASP